MEDCSGTMSQRLLLTGVDRVSSSFMFLSLCGREHSIQSPQCPPGFIWLISRRTEQKSCSAIVCGLFWCISVIVAESLQDLHRKKIYTANRATQSHLLSFPQERTAHQRNEEREACLYQMLHSVMPRLLSHILYTKQDEVICAFMFKGFTSQVP